MSQEVLDFSVTPAGVGPLLPCSCWAGLRWQASFVRAHVCMCVCVRVVGRVSGSRFADFECVCVVLCARAMNLLTASGPLSIHPSLRRSKSFRVGHRAEASEDMHEYF